MSTAWEKGPKGLGSGQSEPSSRFLSTTLSTSPVLCKGPLTLLALRKVGEEIIFCSQLTHAGGNDLTEVTG